MLPIGVRKTISVKRKLDVYELMKSFTLKEKARIKEHGDFGEGF